MKQALDTRTKLLTKNPWPLMIELSIPAVLGMVVVGLYNMMDSIFVGQMVGDVQMGAISVSYPLTLINAGSAAMLGVGSASVLSRAIGKKDENTIKKIKDVCTYCQIRYGFDYYVQPDKNAGQYVKRGHFDDESECA